MENGLCIGCGACAMSCPTRAISMQLGRPDIITERCVKCGACFAQCPRSFLPLPGMNKMMEE
ncbi:MAG TPA: 4Fe-4S binding protein [Methanocellaceae archaeon]